MSEQIVDQIVEQLACFNCKNKINDIWESRNSLCLECYNKGIKVEFNEVKCLKYKKINAFRYGLFCDKCSDIVLSHNLFINHRNKIKLTPEMITDYIRSVGYLLNHKNGYKSSRMWLYYRGIHVNSIINSVNKKCLECPIIDSIQEESPDRICENKHCNKKFTRPYIDYQSNICDECTFRGKCFCDECGIEFEPIYHTEFCSECKNYKIFDKCLTSEDICFICIDKKY
jgi:hypothetical protein